MSGNVLRWSEEQLAQATARISGAVANAPRQITSKVAGDLVKKKRPKYGNTPTTDAAGVKHASKKQSRRYTELGHRMKAGEILMLGREIRFRLPGGVEYRADHVYANQRALEVLAGLVESGDLVVEDVKSEATRNDKAYKIKKKQMRECLGIQVKET